MKTPTKLAAFVLGLGALFGSAAGMGAAFGPDREPVAKHGGDEHAAAPEEVSMPGGLQTSVGGYSIVPHTRVAPTAEQLDYGFHIEGPDGDVVTDFTPTHDKDLHLIVVRRDLTGFEHVHPTMDADGMWSVPLQLGEGAGSYRVFADFDPADGDPVTLGIDLSVPGSYTPQALPEPTRTTTVDGYTVALEGKLTPGTSSKLTLHISRDGKPVTDLQTYLAAYGHLVALREGDLAYLHVHPDDTDAKPGPDVTFYAEVPTAGNYRLFLDFKHNGVVRTAEFTAAAEGQAKGGGDEHGH